MPWCRMSVAASLCAVILASLAVGNCANNSSGGSMPSAAGASVGSDNTVGDLAAADGRTGTGTAVEDTSQDYKIAPRDVLQVTVFQVPDLTRTVQVDNTGFITLPLINTVRVSGMTMRQAQDDITNRLEKSYLRSPQVTLSLLKSGQRVTVNGAVKTPQVITVDGQLTLSQAIAQAGGTNDEVANSERVHVARVSSGHVSDDVFNLQDIQAGKASDPALRGGDIVVVEQSQAKVAFKNIKDLLPFAVLGSIASDARLKRNIRPLYVRADGITVYRYRYNWSDIVYVGVIAQEVERIRPDAVVRGVDGFLRVRYQRLGMDMETCKVWMAMRGPSQQSVDCFAPSAGHLAQNASR